MKWTVDSGEANLSMLAYLFQKGDSIFEVEWAVMEGIREKGD